MPVRVLLLCAGNMRLAAVYLEGEALWEGNGARQRRGMEWYKDDGVSLQECAFTTQFLITWFSEGHSPIFLFKFQKSKKVPSVFSDGTGSDLSD